LQAEKVSQKLMEEMSQIVDEAKLRKVKNDIVWEFKKEILTSPFPQKLTPVVQSYQRDPKAPTLSLVNQDLLYLKKGNLRPEKFVLSLHKFPAVEHWKNPHAKIFYIKRQKEPRKPKEEVYSNSKIVQVIKTTSELGHENKFVTKIIVRRENDSIVSITEPDYKNLNKNGIEDMYLLCINSKVDDYTETRLLWSLLVFIRSTMIWERVQDFQLGVESYQQKVNLIAITITFPDIGKHKMFFTVFEPVYGIIYMNIKKEKRVMRHQEIHKFCDATLKRVLEGLKSYNNDVKHGYVTPSLNGCCCPKHKQFDYHVDSPSGETYWTKLYELVLELKNSARDAYDALFDAQNEVACPMLGSMSPGLQKALENYKAYDMIQELMTMLNWRRNGIDYDSTPKSLEEFCTVPGDGVAILSDTVISYKRRCQDTHDGVKT
ncbi:hypothetical protein Tco_1170618, partial [Tanacetum coccineum]